MKNVMKSKIGAGLIALAFSSVGSINIAVAQTCATPPTCAELGFDKGADDCTGRSTLKCPFDTTKLFCMTAAEAAAGNCDNPNIGTIIYSDKSCSGSVMADKTAIAVVFNPTYRLAIALKTERKYWSTEYFDVPNLTNYGSGDAALQDWAGRANTITVLNYCKANSKSCPAFEYVNSYTTAGTKAGDWYLPAMGELNDIYTNRATLNRSLSLVGGTQLPTDYYHWSSSETDDGYGYRAWGQGFGNGGIYGGSSKGNNGYVRPVLAF